MGGLRSRSRAPQALATLQGGNTRFLQRQGGDGVAMGGRCARCGASAGRPARGALQLQPHLSASSGGSRLHHLHKEAPLFCAHCQQGSRAWLKLRRLRHSHDILAQSEAAGALVLKAPLHRITATQHRLVPDVQLAVPTEGRDGGGAQVHRGLQGHAQPRKLGSQRRLEVGSEPVIHPTLTITSCDGNLLPVHRDARHFIAMGHALRGSACRSPISAARQSSAEGVQGSRVPRRSAGVTLEG